jgi:uncharacterized protein with HEPN domain
MTDRSLKLLVDAIGAIGLRNRIIHGHDSVDDEMLFETIKRDLPMFRDTLATELDKAV